MKKPVSRRKLLSAGASLLASVCASCLPWGGDPTLVETVQPPTGVQPSPIPIKPTPPLAARRPNIIFILVDDLDAKSIDAMPLLDQHIRRKGLTFRNYLFNFPLCCPSRTAALTGMYAHNSLIYTNSQPDGGYALVRQYQLEQNAVAVWLKDAGYRTALIGKYLNGYPGPAKTADLAAVPPGWSEWYSSVKGSAYSEYNYTLNENGKLVEYGKKPEDYGTDIYARKAANFIERSVKDRQPFFMYIAPYAPHGPSTPAPRHANLFPNAQAPRPPSFNEADVSTKPVSMQARPLLTAKEIEKIDQQYRLRLQSLQAVDEMIAQLIEQLQALGELDDTYLFFASDNGFHLGQHRLASGKTMPYEEDICVPLIVRGPGIEPGRQVEALVGNIDLAPTFADLAGATVPAKVDGRSLVPLLASIPLKWRQVFLLEHGAPVAIPDAPQSAPAKTKKSAPVWSQGLRAADYTYVEHTNGERELYDLKSDPYQLENLAIKANPAALKQLSERVNRLRRAGGAEARLLEEQSVPLLTKTGA